MPNGLSTVLIVVSNTESCGYYSTRWVGVKPSVVYCPSGYKLLSGGYYVTGWGGSTGTFSPEESSPVDFYDVWRADLGASRQNEYPIDLSNNQGWYIWTGYAQNGCWKAVATCTR